ncbi:uncharacterized protein LOC136750608 [Amia ocellicauda]|uniref:uncharacterized protein LOC136750608 n=1 Tax=Amia ocellicauda TaxID=2972642 RepID=UPI003463E2C4
MNFRGLSHEQLKSCLKKQDPTLHILADALCEQQVSGNDLINMTAEDVNIVFPYSFPLRKALLEFIKERKSLYSAEHYLISKKGKTKASGPQKMFSAIARSIMIKYMVWRNGMFKKSIDWKPITKEIVDCLPELRGMEREIERRCSCMLQNRRDYLRRVANGTVSAHLVLSYSECLSPKQKRQISRAPPGVWSWNGELWSELTFGAGKNPYI